MVPGLSSAIAPQAVMTILLSYRLKRMPHRNSRNSNSLLLAGLCALGIGLAYSSSANWFGWRLSSADRAIAPHQLPLPEGADVFKPILKGQVTPQSPEIAVWSKTAQPGDTIVLTGWQLSGFKGHQQGSDTRVWVYGQTQAQNGVLAVAKVHLLKADMAAISLPNTLPQGSDYLLWIENRLGRSQPILINAPEAWWIGPDQATREQVVSVFGRNLSHSGGTQKSYVYLQDSKRQGQWAPVVAVNPYKIDFKVPKVLQNGIYQVRVHHGNGGTYGWSEPLQFTLRDGIAYTGPTINVKDKAYGALGNGRVDDTQAIFAAIRDASKTPMSTVFFPPGTYLISQTISGWQDFGKEKIRFQGAGRDKTILKVASKFEGRFLYQVDNGSKITISDLTLDTNRQPLNAILKIRSSQDIQLLNLNLQGQGSGQMNPMDLDGCTRVSIRNSNITGIQTFLGTASQVFIDHSNFYGSDLGASLLAGFGTKQIAITHSTGQNLDTSDPNNRKWVSGRFWVDQPHWSNSQYHYLGNNRTLDLSVPNARGLDQNGGEQILWEEPGSGRPVGSVQAATATSVTFSSAAGLDGSYLLTITAGKGVGQTRQIQSFDAQKKTAVIHEKWNVTPDSSSQVVARRTPSKLVVYQNQLDGLPDYASRYTASTGVQPYYGSADLIIDGNTFHELRSGVSLFVGWTQTGIAASYFTQIVNNQFQDSLIGFNAVLDNSQGPTQQIYLLGTLFAHNRIKQVKVPAQFWMHPAATAGGPYATMTVFEKNLPPIQATGLTTQPSQDNIRNTFLF
jgi:hypothetical protein